MSSLHAVNTLADIPAIYRDTPIEKLLAYHNLNAPFTQYTAAPLLIGMCMDNRKTLTIPENFAFILRSGGANLRMNGFKVSYVIAIGAIRYIALIGHTQCGMVNIASRKEQFINGLIENAGWTRERAEKHFEEYAPLFETGNTVNFIAAQAQHLRELYPNVTVAPLIYRVEDNRLYFVTD